jgi:hypothetical protein
MNLSFYHYLIDKYILDPNIFYIYMYTVYTSIFVLLQELLFLIVVRNLSWHQKQYNVIKISLWDLFKYQHIMIAQTETCL